MAKERHIKYGTTEDFILDKAFSLWVLHPDQDLSRFWSLFLVEHPDLEAQINEAVFIVRALHPADQEISEQRLNEILQNVRHADRLRKRIGFGGWRYAVIIALNMPVGEVLIG